MISRCLRFLNKPQVTLWILWLLFFVPPALAIWSYAHHGLWQRGATNHGQLLKNPPNLATMTVPLQQIRGHWNLWALQPINKNDQQGLYTISQVRKALGKEKMRINRFSTVMNVANETELKNIARTQYEGTEIAVLDKPTLEKLFQKNPQATQWIEQGALFIVDPNGNVILAYQFNEKPAPIFADLRHLLNVSRIG